MGAATDLPASQPRPLQELLTPLQAAECLALSESLQVSAVFHDNKPNADAENMRAAAAFLRMFSLSVTHGVMEANTLEMHLARLRQEASIIWNYFEERNWPDTEVANSAARICKTILGHRNPVFPQSKSVSPMSPVEEARQCARLLGLQGVGERISDEHLAQLITAYPAECAPVIRRYGEVIAQGYAMNLNAAIVSHLAYLAQGGRIQPMQREPASRRGQGRR